MKPKTRADHGAPGLHQLLTLLVRRLRGGCHVTKTRPQNPVRPGGCRNAARSVPLQLALAPKARASYHTTLGIGCEIKSLFLT